MPTCRYNVWEEHSEDDDHVWVDTITSDINPLNDVYFPRGKWKIYLYGKEIGLVASKIHELTMKGFKLHCNKIGNPDPAGYIYAYMYHPDIP